MTEIKRLNYFTSQMLVAQDFTDEQAYHIQKHRLHNQWLHSWGVAGDGLQVREKDPKTIEIGKGIAIDKDGNEILLLDPDLVDLSKSTANAIVWVAVRLQELPDDKRKYGEAENFTRLTETPTIELGDKKPAEDGSVILLATVTLDASGNIAKIANDVRRLAGSMLSPGTRVGPPTPAGANTLDIHGGPRSKYQSPASGSGTRWTGDHRTGLALYVTADSSPASKGVEFRHSNGTQGIGFGYNTIYATGPFPQQPLYLKAFGGGTVVVQGNAAVTGNLNVNAIAPRGDEADLPLTLSSKGTGGVALTGNTTVNGGLTVTGDLAVNTISPTGDKADIPLNLRSKGTGGVIVQGNAWVTGDLTANTIYPQGKEENIPLSLRSKGTGGVALTGNTTVNGSLTVTGEIVQESWKIVTDFKNSWYNFGARWTTAAYFKDSLGIVHLRGLVKTTSLPDATSKLESTIFILPPGYVPEFNSTYLVVSGFTNQPSIYGQIEVWQGGEVVARYGRPAECFSLDGISFRAK